MSRRTTNQTIGRKRKNPSTAKPKAKKQKLDNTNKTEKEDKPQLLQGKQICITGSFKFEQKKMLKLITDHGGKKNATCSKKCNYLLMSNSTHCTATNSNKCKKAKQNNTPIVREQWLYDCIEQQELLDIDDKDKNNIDYVIVWREKRTVAKYPKQFDINKHHKNINNIDIFRKLLLAPQTRDFGMIIYFKALDRYPGGNADMYVIKFILFVNGNHIYLRKLTWSNWDGSNYISKKPFEIKVKNDIHYVNKIANTFIDLYSMDKKQDIYAEIVDKRYDSDEYDTEWSHLYFSVFIPPKYSNVNNDNTNNNSNKVYEYHRIRRYKSDECEMWSKFVNSNHMDIVDIVDGFIGDYDIEKHWLQILCFRRNAIYGSGYGSRQNLPTPKQKVCKQGDILINEISGLCGMMRPKNESPIDCPKSRSATDNETFDKDVEIDMGKRDCYDMPTLLIKGYDY